MTDLPIIPRTSFLGRNERSPAPDRPTRMRTELPHVLFDHAFFQERAGLDLASRRSRDSGRVSLYGAASVSDGSAVWRRRRRLSRHGDLADRPLRFPFFTGLRSSEQAQVIDAVRAFRC